ncbi:MAG: hypothetical protein AAFX50_11920, partial [Acidobacteriota bacterium]
MMKTLVKIAFVCLAASLVAGPAFGNAEVLPYTPMQKADKADMVEAMADLHARLAMLEGPQKSAAFEVRVPADRLDALKANNPNGGPLWVGVHGDVGFSFGTAEKSLALGHQVEADGMTVWSGTFRSAGATGVRLHLTDVNLPKGAELYVFGRHGHAFGPYVGAHKELWTNTVAGEEIVLQLHRPARAERAASNLFKVSQLSHLGDRYSLGVSAEKAFCSWNDSCITNAECSSIPSAVQPAREAEDEESDGVLGR